MNMPPNRFKQALLEGRGQIGLWCSLGSAYAAEAVAGAGFDWLLIDTEHSPNDLRSVLAQLQAVAGYDVSAIVRPASNDAVLIKQYLDVGAQSLLIPYVQTPEEAQAAVAAVRYPPEGMRGVSAMSRASRFGRVKDYAPKAAREICLLLQLETLEALSHLETIAAMDGVDGIFIGPADLAASMGHLGNPGHPEVQAMITQTISRIVALGKPAGVLTPDTGFARRCIEAGARFTAVGMDIALLVRTADALAREFVAPR
jgi:4-hydroxy-2-oxoheptanedioate aldolase